MNDRLFENYEIIQLQKRARNVAVRNGYSQLADDFAQEAAIALVSGRKATLDQLFVDFLRQEYGRTGAYSRPGGRAKAAGRHGQRSLDEPLPGETRLTLADVIASPGGDPEPEPVDWRSLVSLRGRDATVCELRYDHEMSEGEIGELVGVTESRVCQILKGPIAKEIERAAILAERLPEYRDDPDASKLIVDWITL